MMLLDYSARIKFSVPVQNHYFLLRCVPVSRAGQAVSETRIEITPETPLYSHTDSFGNLCLFGYIAEAHGDFRLKVSAKIESRYSKGLAEEPSGLFRAETPLTRFEDGMEAIVSCYLKDFLNGKGRLDENNVLPACLALLPALNREMTYTPGITSIRTKAAEAYALKKGVCQDFSHVFISVMRHLGCPARYVCGVTKGEGATHAWAEVFIPPEGRWLGFDPTRSKVCDDTYIVFSKGRDFTDCQIDRGVFTGFANQNLSVFVTTTDI